MKLPSINYLFTTIKESFLRFPLTLLSSLIGVCTAIYMAEFEKEITNFFPYINTLLTAALGVPLYFCVTIFSEKKDLGKKTQLVLLLGATLLLLGIYFSLPNIETSHNTTLPYIRYGIYNLIIHLLVSFIPYHSGAQLNGFWNYNKILFLRICNAVLYSFFIYIGLILALFALDSLFNIKIHEKLYFDIFIVIIGFFNTSFFVSGIPKQLNELENVTTYPKGLKIFSQYILLPLLLLYLLILYAYGAKILIGWNWPKGIVSYLISGVSVLGIFTILLLYPFGETEDNTWIKKLSKEYYFLLFPLLVLLFIAVGMRINDYGITINRYVIILLGCWLTLVAVYFCIGKNNLKFIPKSLAVILLLMSFGPWSIFSVSEQNQINRLNHLLEQKGLTKSNVFTHEIVWKKDSLPHFYSEKEHTNEPLIDKGTHNEIYSILEYLDNHHGFSGVKPLFKQNIDSLITLAYKKDKYINETEVYMRTMGLKPEFFYPNSEFDYFTFETKTENAILVKGYDYLVTFNPFGAEKTEVLINTKQLVIDYFPNNKNEVVFTANHAVTRFDLNILLKQLVATYGKKDVLTIPKNKMTLTATSTDFDITLEIKNLSGETTKNNTLKINSIAGNIFIRERK